jgi:hypothetical protein
MRIYQFKHHEMFIVESSLSEAAYVALYNELFYELLKIRAICENKIFESINISHGIISSKPFITEQLLRKKILPAFCFLVCKN